MKRLAVILLCVPTTVFCQPAQPRASKHAKSKAAKKALSLPEFVKWLMKDGHDHTLVPGSSGAALDLPSDGVPTKAWGTGRSNPFHMAAVVLDKSASHERPTCLVVEKDQRHLEQNSSESWEFRFRTDGSLERALYFTGRIDSEGKPVLGTAVDTPQDAKSAEVKAKAEEELEFWLAKAYEVTHEAAKTSTPKTSVDPK